MGEALPGSPLRPPRREPGRGALRAELLSPPPRRWKVDLLPAGRKGRPSLLPAEDRFPPPPHGRDWPGRVAGAAVSPSVLHGTLLGREDGRTDRRAGGGGESGGAAREERAAVQGPLPVSMETSLTRRVPPLSLPDGDGGAEGEAGERARRRA